MIGLDNETSLLWNQQKILFCKKKNVLLNQIVNTGSQPTNEGFHSRCVFGRAALKSPSQQPLESLSSVFSPHFLQLVYTV